MNPLGQSNELLVILQKASDLWIVLRVDLTMQIFYLLAVLEEPRQIANKLLH